MQLILLSVRLFTYGAFCDLCSSFCTRMTEKNIEKNKPLNKKLLTFMSNFSHNRLVKWQTIEHRFIRLSLERRSSLLP